MGTKIRETVIVQADYSGTVTEEVLVWLPGLVAAGVSQNSVVIDGLATVRWSIQSLSPTFWSTNQYREG